MKDKFYLTTTLPYVNAEPHIGHAIEFIQADAISRYFRSKLGKENVFFNVGTDEHGQKIFETAKKEELSTEEFVDKYAQRFKDFCKLFIVDYDNFYRTSSKEHHEAARKFWKVCKENGDIYKKKYKGLYCVGCERFLTEKDLVDSKCPDHGTKPEEKEEENYFFKLSQYRKKLLKWFDEHEEFLKPKIKRTELRKILAEMEDISISRLKENLPWGIEVENDPEQVFYVWFDALTNYVNVIGYGTDKKKLKEWWPGVQICGGDNLRFQGAIWQGMLASVGLEQSKKLLVHGMILASDGTKMSKTKGNVISPFEQEQKYGPEIVRFYLLTGIPTYGDAAYKEEELVNSYNARLANNYGNLLNRVIHIANSEDFEINNERKIEKDFKKRIDTMRNEIDNLYENFEIYLASTKIDELADFGNKYITKEEPWGKNINKEVAEKVINNLTYLLKIVSEKYLPIIPLSAERGLNALRNREKIILFPRIQ